MSDQVETLLTQKKKRTDFKPLKFIFNGSSEDLLKKFFLKVKASEGIIKYQMINWEGFPTELDQAKELGKDWAKQFTSNIKYNGYIVNVYFHLEKKTIRFEVKKYSTLEIKNFTLVQSTDSNEYKSQIFSNILAEPAVYIFDSSCWENLDLSTCKELGKNWATELELDQRFAEFKVVVFLNPTLKNIKVTLRSK